MFIRLIYRQPRALKLSGKSESSAPVKTKTQRVLHCVDFTFWLRGKDSNLQPPGYEPDELPIAPPRDNYDIIL